MTRSSYSMRLATESQDTEERALGEHRPRRTDGASALCPRLEKPPRHELVGCGSSVSPAQPENPVRRLRRQVLASAIVAEPRQAKFSLCNGCGGSERKFSQRNGCGSCATKI